MATTLATTTGTAPATVDFQLCDRCGVRARFHAVLLSGGELYLCSHHTSQVRDAVEHAGAWLGPIAL